MRLIWIFKYLWSKVFRVNPQLTNCASRAEDHKSNSGEPSVTLIIPTRDRADLLKKCLDSIEKQTIYSNLEILIVDNDSKEKATLELFERAEKTGHRVLSHPGEFNFSQIINSAVRETSSDLVCVLNNDVEALSPNWLSCLVQHATKPDVAVAGSLLTYPNGKIQHAGIALGFSGVATHVFKGKTSSELSGSVTATCFEVSAVTFACAAFRRDVFDQIGGLDENLKVGLNDVDFCVRAAARGLKNVACTDSWLIHLEYQSRPKMTSARGFARAVPEVLIFIQKHGGLPKDAYFSRKIKR